MIEKFLRKVEFTETCWIWKGAFYSNGYGSFYMNGKQYTAHRAAYILYKCKNIKDKDIDHLCRNIKCVNPEHLEAVSHKENILRGIAPSALNSRRTNCIHGHSLADAYIIKGKRRCRTCQIKQSREYRIQIKRNKNAY